MKKIIIDENQANQRLDKFLLKYLSKAPKSFIHKTIRKKNVKINNVKAVASIMLKLGDEIKLFLSDETIDKFTDEIKIPKADKPIIHYEDDNILIAYKPENVLSQRNTDEKSNSINDMILYYLYKNGSYDPEDSKGFKPSICNRLDRNTSGLIIFGKTLSALQGINKAFRQGEIERNYLAVVYGKVNFDGEKILRGHISKNHDTNISEITENNGKEIETHVTPLNVEMKEKDLSLVKIGLKTGRSHQIRIQLAEIGLPVAGDPKYGDKEINQRIKKTYNINHQLLCGYEIVFNNIENLEYLQGKRFKILPDWYDILVDKK